MNRFEMQIKKMRDAADDANSALESVKDKIETFDSMVAELDSALNDMDKAVRSLREALVAVVQARRAIDRAEVCVLMVSAEEGMREMDATIAGLVQESGRAS